MAKENIMNAVRQMRTLMSDLSGSAEDIAAAHELLSEIESEA